MSPCRVAKPGPVTPPSRANASSRASTRPTTSSGCELNPSEIGLAGHSYGAVGVSYIAQWDPRVKAVVAWDNLGPAAPEGAESPAGRGVPTIGEKACPADPADRTAVPITKPGLGMSADYGLPRRRRPNCRIRWASPKSRSPTPSRRGQRRDHHPRRLASGFQFHPQPGLRSLAAGAGRDRLVHERRGSTSTSSTRLGRQAVAHKPLARRSPRG